MELNGRGNGAAGLHPFLVFPEELWLLIAGKLLDSADILRLLQALPELRDGLEYKKRFWLFDQVIPFLSRWLSDEELLVCRRICRQWSLGVDNLVQNCPVVRAYDHGSQVTGQRWTVDGRPTSIYEDVLLPYAALENEDMIRDFMRYMGEHPSSSSPFVNRGVWVSSNYSNEDASEIFQRFGHHVWFLLVELEPTQPVPEPLQFCHWLVELIGHFPNLKSIRLEVEEGEVDDAAEDEDEDDDDQGQNAIVDYQMAPVVAPSNPNGNPEEGARPHIPVQDKKEEQKLLLEPWREPLPNLPQLESLSLLMDPLPSAMVSALVGSYSKQIRRLILHLRHWRSEFSTAFPNLTELTVIEISSSVELNYFLLFLQAPLLYDLMLGLEGNCRLEMGTEILPWLRRFPLVRNAHFSGEAGVTCWDANMFSPALCSIPSIKYLCVVGSSIFTRTRTSSSAAPTWNTCMLMRWKVFSGELRWSRR